MRIIEEIIDLTALKEIGRGNHRIVYKNPFNKEEVLKYSYNPYKSGLGGNSNYIEWRVWNAVKDDSSISKYFCPITGYTNDYSVITMLEASPMKKSQFSLRLLDKLPALLRLDVNRAENWGILEGRPVLVDYGFNENVKYLVGK